MAGCISDNEKTIASFDTTTMCKRVRENKPCAYCYVVSARNIGCRAKVEVDHIEYTGEIKRMRKDRVDRLREVGGIRAFSFGDYIPKHKKDVKEFLDDCAEIKLDVKVITKELQFVRDFHDHPAIKVIHISVDGIKDKNVGRSPITLQTAKAYRAKYSKVLIRAVCLNDKEVDTFGSNPSIDILTLNHGKALTISNKYYTHEDVKRVAEKFPAKVCCADRNCESCAIKCGINKDGTLTKFKTQTVDAKIVLESNKAHSKMEK